MCVWLNHPQIKWTSVDTGFTFSPASLVPCAFATGITQEGRFRYMSRTFLTEEQKEANKEALRQKWKRENPEKHKAAQKKYRDSHPRPPLTSEERRTRSEYKREWERERRRKSGKRIRTDTQKRKLSDANAARYANNREAIKKRCRAWAHSNPEKRRSVEYARRARKLGAPVGDVRSISKWEKKWRLKASVRCYWCQKMHAPKKCHVDHIIPLVPRNGIQGSHSIGNVCISCQPCNNRKHAKTLAEWNSKLEQPALL